MTGGSSCNGFSNKNSSRGVNSDSGTLHSLMSSLRACGIVKVILKQACKPQSYSSMKLQHSHLITGVKCRATCVAKKKGQFNITMFVIFVLLMMMIISPSKIVIEVIPRCIHVNC